MCQSWECCLSPHRREKSCFEVCWAKALTLLTDAKQIPSIILGLKSKLKLMGKKQKSCWIVCTAVFTCTSIQQRHRGKKHKEGKGWTLFEITVCLLGFIDYYFLFIDFSGQHWNQDLEADRTFFIEQLIKLVLRGNQMSIDGNRKTHLSRCLPPVMRSPAERPPSP